MTFACDLVVNQLAEDLLSLLEDRPLDDIIDTLAGAFRCRATDLRAVTNAGDFYLAAAQELEALKHRDFELSETAVAQLQPAFPASYL